MTESEPRKLNNLRVIDLRCELEKRNIDKNGVKAILLEKLEKALREEGHDPETYVFDDPAGKQTPKRSRRSEGDDSESVDVSEDDKDESVSEEINASQGNETKVEEDNSSQETENSSATDLKKNDPESAKPVKESPSKESGVELQSEKVTDDTTNKTAPSDTSTDNQKVKPSQRKSARKSVADENQKSSDEKETAPEASRKFTEEKKTPSKTKADNDDGKATPEANGIDNEDSINLTIEDDEKLLADEEDVSQDKDNKDESLSGAGQHKQTSGEKNQDKVNSEDKEEKSGSAEEAAKDDKSKKPAVGGTNTSRNLWVSSLSSATRATDLKQVFSKFGKVVGAKVVTNARTPGARCYGYVTMASSDDATKAIESLHLTELHGRMISVEKAKGDSSGPPKRSTDSSKTDPSTPKKVEDRKRERDRVSSRSRPEIKTEEIVPPGTEGDIKTEPAAPGTEGEVSAETEAKDKDTTHRSRDISKTDHRSDKRPRSTTSSHRSRDRSKHRRSSPNVLTFSKIKEERDKQLMREKERMLREEQRRRDSERQRQREIERRQKEEYLKLERERHKLKLERERVDRERTELLKLKRERQRLERERHRIEREKLEREKEELERLKRQTLNRLEEERRKRSLSSSRDREYEGNRKRQATEVRYDTSHGRFQDNRADFKKESSHKTSEVSNSRHYVADSWKESTGPVMEDWSKDRFSSRYVERTGGSFRNQDESVSARAKSDRHPRDRYQDTNKGERYTERQVETWHGGNVGMKSFGSSGNGRDTWVSGASERKVDSSQSWPRPPANANRWSGGGGPLNMNNRGGPQVGPGSIFPPNLESGMPGLGILGMGPFSGNSGNRFESYKLPY